MPWLPFGPALLSIRLWHSLHSRGRAILSEYCWTVPCGSWQLSQFSRTGACSSRNGPRFERVLQLMLARHALHDRVAVHAGEPTLFVNAALPHRALAALMAGETNRILFFRSARIVGLERHNSADATSAAGLHVRRARTVAVLAGELARLRQADAAHERLL